MPQSTEGVAHTFMYRQRGKILVRYKGVVVGTYASEKAAAPPLAARMGMEVNDLPMRARAEVRPTPGGVYFNYGRFEVRRNGEYHGRYETAKKAALKLAVIAQHRPATKVEARSCNKKRFKELKRIFKNWRPADITDLIQTRKKQELFCLAPGPLYVLAIMGKEGPWRAAIVRLTRKMSASKRVNMCALTGRTGPDPASCAAKAAAAKDVHGILVAACKAMARRPIRERKFWNTVNKNVSHHSGWLPVMQRIGILAKTPNNIAPGSLVFGDPDSTRSQAYQTMPFSQTQVEWLSKMGDMQQSLLATKAPKTINDWIDGLMRFKKAASKTKKDAYGVLWTFRSAMIAEMAAAGIKRMGYKSSNTMTDVVKAFPDQSRWIKNFCSEGNSLKIGTSISKFVRAIEYKDSVEFLTMDLCILMTVARGMSAKDVKNLEPQIKKSKLAMDKKLIGMPGCESHPALVVQQAAIDVRPHP